MNVEEDYRFEIALSFAGDNKRNLVRKVAELLQEKVGEGRVFFDEWFISEIAGQDAQIVLQNFFCKRTRLVVTCVCQRYNEKPWTQDEWRAIQSLERNLRDANNGNVKRMRFLPLRFGDGEVDGLFSTAIIPDVRKWPPDEIAELILKRLHHTKRKSTGVYLQQAHSRKVCMISSEFPPIIHGGLGVHVRELTNALSKEANTEINLVLPHCENGYVGSGAQLRLWPMAKIKATYKDLVSWLRFSYHVPEKIRASFQPDVVHCHDWCTILGGIWYSRISRIPLVFHLHLPSRGPLSASVMNLGLLCADLVTVNSEYIKQELTSQMNIRRVEVVPNGVNTTFFFPSENWPQEDGYILFVGRLVEQKGVEFLLRAMTSIRERFPEVNAKIVGEGGYKSALEHLSASLGLTENVEFVGWHTGEALTKYYQNACVVVVPSTYEPFGMTALEGMASRRPVVVARTGGLSSILNHGVSGYVFESQDHLDLAQWIMALLANEKLRQEMGTEAWKVATGAPYKWSTVAKKFVELYDDLIQNPVDNKIPLNVVEKYVSQIRRVAIEMDPTLGSSDNPIIDRLFDWMEEL